MVFIERWSLDTGFKTGFTVIKVKCHFLSTVTNTVTNNDNHAVALMLELHVCRAHFYRGNQEDEWTLAHR